jgi:acetyl-CoA carboxylase biotin carboxyl carrier protein
MGQPKNKRPPAEAPSGMAVVEQLLALMAEHDLVEIAFEQGELKVVLKKAGANVMTVPAAALHAPQLSAAAPPAPAASAAAPPAEAATGPRLLEIKSPMVGTFYSASDPNSDPFIEVGARVTDETVVCIIEAMKVMNEIKAECCGTIEQVCVKTGQAVEFGQVLFKVAPD